MERAYLLQWFQVFPTLYSEIRVFSNDVRKLISNEMHHVNQKATHLIFSLVIWDWDVSSHFTRKIKPIWFILKVAWFKTSLSRIMEWETLIRVRWEVISFESCFLTCYVKSRYLTSLRARSPYICPKCSKVWVCTEDIRLQNNLGNRSYRRSEVLSRGQYTTSIVYVWK